IAVVAYLPPYVNDVNYGASRHLWWHHIRVNCLEIRAIIKGMAVMARRKSKIVALTLRCREELRRRLENRAKSHEHSLNNEIVQRLEDSFDFGDERERHHALLKALTGDSAQAAMVMQMIADLITVARIHGKPLDFRDKAIAEAFRSGVNVML